MKEEYSKEFHMPGNFGELVSFLSLLGMVAISLSVISKKVIGSSMINTPFILKDNLFIITFSIIYLFIIIFLLKAIYHSITGYKIRITDEGLFIRNKKKAHIYWGDYEGYSINGTLVTFKGKHKGVGELKEEMDFGNLAHWIEPELKKQLPKLPPKKEKGVKKLIKKYLNLS
jgi:predicted membrane protein